MSDTEEENPCDTADGHPEEDEDRVPRISKDSIPADADWDPILELDRVEEMLDDNGLMIKAWRCESCDLRFQYYASFDKHNQREHPNYKPSKRWVIMDEDMDDDQVPDDAYLVDSNDSEFEPNSLYRKKKRIKKRMRDDGREWIRGPYLKKSGRPGRPFGYRKRGPGRPRLTDAERKQKEAAKPEPKPCPVCHLMFDNKKLLDSHYRRNHFLPYSCSHCKKRFENFKKFYVHCENVHDEEVDDVLHATLSDAGESDFEDCRVPVEGRTEPVLFPCNLCSNVYPTEVVLAGHKLRQHADEIPDLAVIESLKRLWRGRFDPEHIKLHESVLEKLGPIEQERLAAGLPALPKRKNPYVPRLSLEERRRRAEERRERQRLRKEAGIKSSCAFPRDENGKFLGTYRTEEEKELARLESNKRRNEGRRLLYQAQREAKELGLPIPKTLREAGIVMPSHHPFTRIADGNAPENVEQLVLQEAAESMNIEPVPEGEARPKRKSQLKAVESIREYAQKLGIVKKEKEDGDAGDPDEGGDHFDNDTDFMATENEDGESSEDSGDDAVKFKSKRSPKKAIQNGDSVNPDDPQASTSGAQANGTGEVKKKRRRAPRQYGKDESRICPFTGKILTGSYRPSSRRNGGGETDENPKSAKSRFDMQFPDTCRKCNVEFSTDKAVVKHIGKVHFDPSDPRRSVYKEADPAGYEAMMRRARTAFKCKEEDCPVAYYRYAYVEELAAHMHKEHQKKMFDSDGKEVDTVIPAKERAMKPQNRFQICSVCEHVVRGDRMEQHNWFMHTPEGLPLTFPCDFPDCDFACRFAHKLVWHRRSVHMTLRNIACTYCDKKFGTPYQLRKHIRIHEGYRYKCRFCEESFKSAQGKINHELVNHSGKGQEHECDQCGKMFWYAREVRKHKLKKHGEELPFNRNAENAAMRRVNNAEVAVVGASGTLEAQVPEGQEVQPPKRKRAPRKPAAPKDPNAPKRSRSKKKNTVDPNEGNRAVESLDLEGLQDSTVGSDVEVHPDLYRAVHDQLTNETVYVLQEPYNAANAQVYHQPLHNQNQPQHHSMTTRSQQIQYQPQQTVHQPQPQPIVVIQSHNNPQQQQHHHHVQQQQHHHHHQQQQHQLHHVQPVGGYGLYLQAAPVACPPVEGDCKLCGIRDRDIRLHYIGFHKIPEDKAHFFMAM